MRKFTTISLWIFIPIIIGCLFYFFGNPLALFNQPEQNDQGQQPVPEQPSNTEEPTPTEPVIEYKEYEEKPASTDAAYFEKVVKVKTEYVYIASPLKVEVKNPPILIVYSHGSNTTVTTDMTDPFMKDMQMYGKYFAKRGFAFAASSEHGVNYGSAQSVADIIDLKEYISKKYLIQEKINLLGFSMGGLPTLNFLFKYPTLVNKVALLAPVSGSYTQAQYTSIKKIPIHIWHGNKDVNVPLSASTSFKTSYNAAGFKNLTLEIIDGKGHFDIDTEKVADIYDFFK